MNETAVISFSLILARVGGFVSVLPQFGGRGVPRLVKVGLAFALACLWFGSLDVSRGGGPEMHSSIALWLAYGVLLGRESVIGAVMGFMFGLFLLPARVAGEFLGQEMGLSLGSLTNPAAESSATLVGQLFETLATLVFFGLDGHHVWLAALHATFARWPIGHELGALPVGQMVHGMALAQEWGLLLAAPVASCLFVSSVVLALLARAAPQLNIMSIGFTLRLGVGFVAAIVFLPETLSMLGGLFGRFGEILISIF